MKKLYTLLTAIILATSAFAQAPEKMSYQAVVRDASDALVATQAVGIQISILQTTATGTAVYTETQTPTTNANGLVSLEIGSGTVVSGTFNTIDWANDTYFIKTETDPTGGTTYTITGTSQLMSVPYALYAKTSGNGAGPQGPDGADGIDGVPGADGIDGAPGADGIDGAPGADGIDGEPGADGIDGAPGADGIDGAPGADGVDGAPGADGSDGNPGADGSDGTPGADGIDGAPGADGLDGNPGADGSDGNPGADGADGADGTNGTDGVDGIDGATEPTYTIGLYPELGGYVFWISTDGKHGLVVATQDQSASNIEWHDAKDNIANPASHNAMGQEFRDWRLPTKYELTDMYPYVSAIGGFNIGGGILYWASTDNTSGEAWVKYMGSSFYEAFQSKSFTGFDWRLIRAVRSF